MDATATVIVLDGGSIMLGILPQFFKKHEQ